MLFFFFQLIRSKPKTETKVHFLALGIRCMFSRAWRKLHGSVSNSDWFTALSRLLLVPWFITALQNRSESSNYQIWGSDTACTEKNSRWTHPWVYAINYSLEVESTLTMSNSFSFSSYSTFSSSSLKSGANALQFSCAKIQRPTIVWKLLLTFILLRLLTTSEPRTSKPN